MIPQRGFPIEEYQTRLDRAQQFMRQSGLDALLLTRETEVRYFTGYLTRFWESPTRPWFLIVPAMGKPVAVIPSIGSALMEQTWIDDIRCWSSPDLEDDGVTLLASTLSELSPEDAAIGVPDGHETCLRMPLASFEALKLQLQQRRLVGDHGIIAKLRGIKSPLEVEKIRHACAIANRAFARVPEIAREGVNLDQIFRKFQMLCLEEGADWVPYLAGGADQGGYRDVISPARAVPLHLGDVLMLDTGLVWDGYFCDFDRNWSVGPASDAVRKAHETLCTAVDCAAEIARPGKTAADLFHVINDVVSKENGATDAGRLGHGLGMSLTEWPSLIPADTTVLEPGMVLTLEPGIMIGNKIMVHEENILVTEDHVEFLSSRAPSDIPML